MKPIKQPLTHSPKTIAVVYNTASYLWISRQPLLRALLANGYRVIAIAPPAPESRQIEDLGITFIPLRYLDRRGTSAFRDWQFLRELKRIYRQEAVELALHFTIKPVIYGSLAARATGVQVINTVTGLGYSFIKGGWIIQIVRRMYRMALSGARQTLFQNPDDYTLFLEAGLVKASQAGLVPGSGIDTDYFQQEPMPEDGPLQFLFVGRLLGDKGVREFVAAAEELAQQQMSLLDSGSVIPNRNSESTHPPGDDVHLRKSKKIRCAILGGIDHQNPAAISEAELASWQENSSIDYLGTTTDIRPHIINATAVVLPSYREGLPRVLLEGAAIGRPLIATDVPGCREVVEQQRNGYLVPVKDVESLAAAMLRMASLESDERTEMGRCSRQIAEERFDVKLVVAQYLAIIESLTD